MRLDPWIARAMKNPPDTRLCRFTHGRGWIPVKEGVESLSPRELEVMKLYAVGVRGRQAAKQLSVSYATVSVYRDRVFEKLHLESQADVVHFALFHNLVENKFESQATTPRLIQLPRAYA